MRIVVVAGKFDFIHAGHVDSIIKASKLGDYLIIVTHRDDIVAKCSDKGFCAVPLEVRCMLLRGLIKEIGVQGMVIVGRDEDGTVCNTLEFIRDNYPKDQIVFAKGGDRTLDRMNTDEIVVCRVLNIKIQYGVGDLLGSSSKMMARISKPLSAKADSFSLPNPNKGGREVRVVYETPTTNVSRSDSISG